MLKRASQSLLIGFILLVSCTTANIYTYIDAQTAYQHQNYNKAYQLFAKYQRTEIKNREKLSGKSGARFWNQPIVEAWSLVGQPLGETHGSAVWSLLKAERYAEAISQLSEVKQNHYCNAECQFKLDLTMAVIYKKQNMQFEVDGANRRALANKEGFAQSISFFYPIMESLKNTSEKEKRADAIKSLQKLVEYTKNDYFVRTAQGPILDPFDEYRHYTEFLNPQKIDQLYLSASEEVLSLSARSKQKTDAIRQTRQQIYLIGFDKEFLKHLQMLQTKKHVEKNDDELRLACLFLNKIQKPALNFSQSIGFDYEITIDNPYGILPAALQEMRRQADVFLMQSGYKEALLANGADLVAIDMGLQGYQKHFEAVMHAQLANYYNTLAKSISLKKTPLKIYTPKILEAMAYETSLANKAAAESKILFLKTDDYIKNAELLKKLKNRDAKNDQQFIEVLIGALQAKVRGDDTLGLIENIRGSSQTKNFSVPSDHIESINVIKLSEIDVFLPDAQTADFFYNKDTSLDFDPVEEAERLFGNDNASSSEPFNYPLVTCQ